MEVANGILSKMDEELPLVEPVVRHGDAPTFVESKRLDFQQIKAIYDEIKARGHKSVALICKTTAEANSMNSALEKYGLDVQQLTEVTTINQSKLLIVPSHLAKGLEFDAVIITALETPFYDTVIDRKLLYVALTRAMHLLYLVGPSREAFLLK